MQPGTKNTMEGMPNRHGLHGRLARSAESAREADFRADLQADAIGSSQSGRHVRSASAVTMLKRFGCFFF